MNYLDLLAPAIQIAAAIGGAIAELLTAGSVTIAPIRTYFGRVHLEIDIAIKTVPPQ